jgi:hypothetical protein
VKIRIIQTIKKRTPESAFTHSFQKLFIFSNAFAVQQLSTFKLILNKGMVFEKMKSW